MNPTPQTRIDPGTVKGWGIDADERNDPAYPMRHREGDGSASADWIRPALQESRVEILRSIEHNRLPAVLGTSTPPRGVSGRIRRIAFGYSESDWRHWLMLLCADRFDAAQGVVGDLSRGHVPNLWAETGGRAAWRHNRAGVVRKGAIIGVVSLALLAVLKHRR